VVELEEQLAMIPEYRFVDEHTETQVEEIKEKPKIVTFIKPKSIGHIVLTVKSVEVTCKFYKEVLGMQVIEF
jgi:catechol-2,3-dioxygenase